METGHWCKDNIPAHNGKVVCIVPIPDDCVDENVEDRSVTVGAGTKRDDFNPDNSNRSGYSDDFNRDNSIRDNSFHKSLEFSENYGLGKGHSKMFRNKLHVATERSQSYRKGKRSLYEEAKDMLAVTKLPSMRFISASKDGTVKLWDTSVSENEGQHKSCALFEGHDRRVSCISFVGKVSESPGKAKKSYHFLTGSYDGTCKLWDTSETKCKKTYTTTPAGDESAAKMEITSIACIECQDEESRSNQTPQLFVNGYKSGKVRLWNLWEGNCLRIFEQPSNPSKALFPLNKKRKSRIYSICSMEDSQHFAAGSLDGKIKMWDVRIGKIDEKGSTETITEIDDEASCEELTTTPATIQTITVPVKVFDGHEAAVLSVKCVSPGSVLLSGSEDKLAKLWSVLTGACLQVFDGHKGPICDVAIVDQLTFLTASRDRTIRAWDAVTGKDVRTYENSDFDNPITAVSTAHQSGCFMSGDERGTIGLWIFSAIDDKHDRAVLGTEDHVMVCEGCQCGIEDLNEEEKSAEEYSIMNCYWELDDGNTPYVE